jgi:hypothetical protein
MAYLAGMSLSGAEAFAAAAVLLLGGAAAATHEIERADENYRDHNQDDIEHGAPFPGKTRCPPSSNSGRARASYLRAASTPTTG